VSDSYGNIIPQRWVIPSRATKFEQQILVNWLQLEVPHKDQHKAEPLKGWRNSEVYYFIKYVYPDWTMGACC
jgi:hypothetical protein